MEVRPTDVRLLTASRVLEIEWADGKRSRYTFPLLRSRCQCTECKSAVIRNRQETLPPNENVAIVNVLPVGNYALQFVFDDGHDRGIYPYAYLRELG
ncbi:MAG TPA: DUF971 domain-containing protein [Pyrinomonadaceae bacterium]|nr:DUF971 domain-containing protein [Pyrinomonadaceae bacterium]